MAHGRVCMKFGHAASTTGKTNSITDVAGVAVGHQTIVEGDAVRTGITVIKPHAGNVFLSKVPAAVHVANGFGKLVGTTQVAELGVIETPIVLTNPRSTFAVADAVVGWTISQPGCETINCRLCFKRFVMRPKRP